LNVIQINGRSSSVFTRVTLIFARELAVPFELVPVRDMAELDAAAYGDNPALKLPTLRRAGSLLFGAENICRALQELATNELHIVWPERLRGDVSRNAQELVWHAMAAQVQLTMGTVIAELPPDNLYFAKIRLGLEGALRWLEDHLDGAQGALPASRDLSLFEVTLFCLVEHLAFRPMVSLEPYPRLRAFSQGFSSRPSAALTAYRFDT
jgi:glutathione S-transferase